MFDFHLQYGPIKGSPEDDSTSVCACAKHVFCRVFSYFVSADGRKNASNVSQKFFFNRGTGFSAHKLMSISLSCPEKVCWDTYLRARMIIISYSVLTVQLL